MSKYILFNRNDLLKEATEIEEEITKILKKHDIDDCFVGIKITRNIGHQKQQLRIEKNNINTNANVSVDILNFD